LVWKKYIWLKGMHWNKNGKKKPVITGEKKEKIGGAGTECCWGGSEKWRESIEGRTKRT